MNDRMMFAVCFVLLVGLLLLSLPGPIHAQEAEAFNPVMGRDLVETPTDGGVVGCDATTGQCWIKHSPAA